MTDPAPLLSVVSGRPTDAELAALVAVVAARGAAGDAPAASSEASTWSAPGRLHRAPLAPGPDGWSRSALPH